MTVKIKAVIELSPSGLVNIVPVLSGEPCRDRGFAWPYHKDLTPAGAAQILAALPAWVIECFSDEMKAAINRVERTNGGV